MIPVIVSRILLWISSVILPTSLVLETIMVPKEAELWQVKFEADGVFPLSPLCASTKAHLLVVHLSLMFVLFAHRRTFGHHCECTS